MRLSMARVADSDEYKHLVAEGVPADSAWCAAWVDRAYKYLASNGMDGASAYAQALSLFFANGLNAQELTPEAFVGEVLHVAYQAKEEYPALEPHNPESSKLLRRQGLKN
jgi:hypothetical protein